MVNFGVVTGEHVQQPSVFVEVPYTFSKTSSSRFKRSVMSSRLEWHFFSVWISQATWNMSTPIGYLYPTKGCVSGIAVSWTWPSASATKVESLSHRARKQIKSNKQTEANTIYSNFWWFPWILSTTLHPKRGFLRIIIPEVRIKSYWQLATTYQKIPSKFLKQFRIAHYVSQASSKVMNLMVFRMPGIKKRCFVWGKKCRTKHQT